MQHMKTSTDTIVIGGGVGGLHAMLRLLDSGRNVILVDMHDSIGGRAITDKAMATTPSTDYGAMRVLQGQPLIHHVIAESLPGDVLQKINYGKSYYRLRGASGNDSFGRYELGCAEQGLLPAELVLRSITQFLRSVSLPSLIRSEVDKELEKCIPSDRGFLARKLPDAIWRQIAQEGRWFGRAIADISLGQIVSAFLSVEAAQLVRDALGYQSFSGGWNASEGIPWFLSEFASPDPYRHISGGVQSLLSAMHNRCIGYGCAAQILHGKCAARLRRVSGGLYQVAISSSSGGESQCILANEILFCIPIDRMLKMQFIGMREQAYWEVLRNRLDAGLDRHSAVKLFLRTRAPWWLDSVPDMNCRIYTNTPIRQLYLWGHAFGVGGGALAMAYMDGHSAITVSEALSLTGARPNRIQIESVEDAVSQWLPIWLRDAVPAAEYFGKKEKFEARCVRWIAPNCASWHTWRLGVDAAGLRQDAMQPLGPSENVWYASESIAVDQAWLEGALRSAERALVVGMGLQEIYDSRLSQQLYKAGFGSMRDYLNV